MKPNRQNFTLIYRNVKKDDVTLKSISVSPFSTSIDIDGVGDRCGIRLKDNNGNELEAVVKNYSIELLEKYGIAEKSVGTVIDTFSMMAMIPRYLLKSL